MNYVYLNIILKLEYYIGRVNGSIWVRRQILMRTRYLQKVDVKGMTM